MQVTCLQRKLVLVTSSPSETSIKSAYDTRYTRSRKRWDKLWGSQGCCPSKIETSPSGSDVDYLGGNGGGRNRGYESFCFFSSSIYYLPSSLQENLRLFYDLRSRNVGYSISTRLMRLMPSLLDIGRCDVGVEFFMWMLQ